jgi:uncharacterized protein (UPF0332 family)
VQLARYRLQQAKETLREAEILASEQSWRGAINRAYYAMFYAATALLRSKDIAPANTAEYSRRLRNSLLNPV